MAKVIVKPWVKFFGIAVGVIALMFGIFKFGGGSDLIKNDKDVIVVGTNTYAGFMPFMYLNGGLEPSEDSYIYQNYGLKLKIVIQDDFQAGRAAFRNGDIDVLYCTADALPVEMSEGSEMTSARLFNISNWSRGADAIVASKNVNTVQDLIGKVVACSEGTASHTLLLNTLETSGIGYDRVNMGSGVESDKVNVKVVGSGLDAAAIFKAGQCDAAVVFSPDDQDIVASMPGSKVLMSTKQATSIICDCLLAKATYLESNHDKIQKLVAALLDANVKMNSDEAAVAEAARVFARAYGTDEQFAIDGSKNIHYCTLGDEANFFGLNSSYTGVKGDELYSKMSRTYAGLGLCSNPLAWRKVSDASFIEALYDAPNQVQGEQSAEATQQFTQVTEQQAADMTAVSDKKIVIEFGTNSSTLDNTAQAIVDREVATLLRQFAGTRVKIVGNTDDTGNYDYNVNLSRQRAEAVKNYLVRTYGFDANRFVVVGNGPKKAREAGVTGASQEYRTTDFQILN